MLGVFVFSKALCIKNLFYWLISCYNFSMRKGFTLIELIVVIAIITLLSTIVLGSLNSARNKSADSAIKGQMATLRSQAELYNDANGNSYANVCNLGAAAPNGTKGIYTMLVGAANITASSIVTNAATAGAANTVTCHATVGSWVAEAPLKSNPSIMWCVDNSGVSQSSGAVNIDGTGGTNQYKCP